MRQKKQKNRCAGRRKWLSGVTLVELIITMAIAVIPISSVTVLVVGGQHSWGRTYLSANRRIKSDAEASCTIFGKIGRMSNGENTALIASSGRSSRGSRGPKIASTSTSYGTGIEFRYWEQAQQSNSGRSGRRSKSDWSSRTTVSTTTPQTNLVPTEYARFYLGGDDKLKIDYGPYPYDSMTRVITRTVVIAENVTRVKFHRTIENNAGQRCVKMEITLRDPNDGKVITIKTATLMRN